VLKANIQLKKNERRLKVERRRFHYSEYIPERRSGRERRIPVRWLLPAGLENFVPTGV